MRLCGLPDFRAKPAASNRVLALVTAWWIAAARDEVVTGRNAQISLEKPSLEAARLSGVGDFRGGDETQPRRPIIRRCDSLPNRHASACRDANGFHAVDQRPGLGP